MEDKKIIDKIYEALKNVYDREIMVDIVNLGLIYSVLYKDGEAQIEMTLTSPTCPMAKEILFEVENEVLKIEEVKSVKINLTFSPPWTKERMSEEAKTILNID